MITHQEWNEVERHSRRRPQPAAMLLPSNEVDVTTDVALPAYSVFGLKAIASAGDVPKLEVQVGGLCLAYNAVSVPADSRFTAQLLGSDDLYRVRHSGVSVGDLCGPKDDYFVEPRSSSFVCVAIIDAYALITSLNSPCVAATVTTQAEPDDYGVARVRYSSSESAVDVDFYNYTPSTTDLSKVLLKATVGHGYVFT